MADHFEQLALDVGPAAFRQQSIRSPLCGHVAQSVRAGATVIDAYCTRLAGHAGSHNHQRIVRVRHTVTVTVRAGIL